MGEGELPLLLDRAALPVRRIRALLEYMARESDPCRARTPSYPRRMTEAIAFDTHRLVKRLTGCGFTEEQAKTLADEQVALLNRNLATRTDIARNETRIEALRQETRATIESVKSDLLKLLFGALIA